MSASNLAGAAVSIGELARRLREAAGISRRDLANQTGLLTTAIRSFETSRIPLSREQMGRHRPTHTTWRKLLRAACMATLPERAKELGVSLGLEVGDPGGVEN